MSTGADDRDAQGGAPLNPPRPLQAPRGPSRIAQICREFGVTPRALRFYEQQGLLAPIRREQARFYSARDRARLKLILGGRRAGFRLREIGALLDVYDKDGKTEQQAQALPQMKAQVAVLEARRRGLDAAIEALKAASARLSQAGADDGADQQPTQRQA
jgi:DNA-binding transcriptional MerR regulator